MKFIRLGVMISLIVVITSFISLGATKEVNTHDKNNYRYNIGPAENTNTGDIAIVKYYETENSNGETEVIDYFVSYCGAEAINILDESEYNYYELTEWFTSTNKYVPTTSGDIYYNKVKQLYNNGPYNGASTYKINSNNNNFKVLHILYKFNPSFNKKVNVVKVLQDTEGNIKNISEDKGVIVNNFVYTAIEQVGTFKLSNSYITDDLVTKDNIEIKGIGSLGTDLGANIDISILDNTLTIVLVYIESGNENKVITLQENEISKKYTLVDLSKSDILEPFSRTYNKVASKTCKYKYRTSSGRRRTCSNSCDREYNDSNYSYILNNTENYSKEFIWDRVISDNKDSNQANDTDGFESDNIYPNLTFILHRQYKDKPTIYPLHNSEEILNDIKGMGYTVSYIPENTRYNSLTETESGTYWKDTFRTNWVCTVNEIPTGDYECSSHGNRGSWKQDSSETYGKDTYNLNNNYNSDSNVKIFTYLGLSGSGKYAQTTSNSILEIDGRHYGSHLSSINDSSHNLRFYPYIKMNYETLDGGKKDIFITSENISDMRINNRLEIGVYKENPSDTNLSLESTQWNTSNKVQIVLDENKITDKDSVLPGGSIYTLDKKDNNLTLICIRSYQTVIPDELKGYIESGDIKTESEAKLDYSKFQDEARDVLINYQVVQWIGNGIDRTIKDFTVNGTAKQVSGAGKVSNFEGVTLSNDSKYYLKDTSGVDKATLDILSDTTNQKLYRVYSDTDGIVYVARNNEIIAQMNKYDTIDKLLSNSEIDILNTKTKIIENYIEAIDRNKGTDENGDTWYNEAFDGIEVLCNEWLLQIGIDGKRTSVLDPKLCGTLDSRSDTYNKDKFRTSQFKLSSKSSSIKAHGKPAGYIGTLDGMVLRFNGISDLYKSKLFYIPNTTVKDLN